MPCIALKTAAWTTGSDAFLGRLLGGSGADPGADHGWPWSCPCPLAYGKRTDLVLPNSSSLSRRDFLSACVWRHELAVDKLSNL